MNKIDVSKCEYYNCGDCFVEPQVGYCGEFRGYGKCDNKDCYYKQLQQLKAEYEELKKENEEIYKIGCENFVVIDQAKRLYKLNKCLDEIEEIVKEKCEDCTIDDYSYCPECRYEAIRDIRNKIKEVKEE